MPIGKEVGSFSTNSTSITKGVDSAGNHTFALNLEGTVTGDWNGTVLVTLTCTTPDFKSGTFTTDAAAYLEDGNVITASGNGVIAALGGHRWRLNGVERISDGSRDAFEGEIDLASRSYNGKMYEVT